MHRFIHGTIDSDLLDAAVGIDLSFPVLFMQLKVEHACVVVLHWVLRSVRVIVLHALISLMLAAGSFADS